MDTTVTGKLDELTRLVQWAGDEIDTLRAQNADLLAALKAVSVRLNANGGPTPQEVKTAATFARAAIARAEGRADA